MPTDFDQIKFNEQYHTYTLDGKRLENVTGLVGKLKQPFDRDGIAARKAAERGITVDKILAEWDRARQDGQNRGTAVHNYIYDRLTQPATLDKFLALNDQAKLPEMVAFDNLWAELSQIANLTHAEWIVGDYDLGIAGTVDALLWATDGSNTCHLWDWKTGKEFNVFSPWGKTLMPPFDDQHECELTIYSLQLSLYRLIIEANFGPDEFPLGDSYIAHLHPAGIYTIHKAIDFRERLLSWLKDGKQ